MSLAVALFKKKLANEKKIQNSLPAQLITHRPAEMHSPPDGEVLINGDEL